MINQFPTQPVYPTKSALQNYYLQSSLPEYIVNKHYTTKPLPKTREFYKNDTFIWNNPYRSNRKNYKFYHQKQQQFKATEDKIRNEALMDKQKKNNQRIILLKQLRQQDRNRLKSRKKEREELQNSASGEFRMSTLNNNGSLNGRYFIRKDQRTCRTEQRRSATTSTTDLAIQKMVKSALMRERQERFQQLRDRKAQIQQLTKKSGQASILSRPMTSIRKSHRKFKEQ